MPKRKENEEAELESEGLICGESYSRSASGEGWIQCSQCHLWAHDACSGADEIDHVCVCDHCAYNPLAKKMPVKYNRKTQRGNYSLEKVNAALHEIVANNRKIREVFRTFEIPEATLRRKLKIKNKQTESKSQSLGRAPVFSPIQEKEIAHHVITLAKLFFGLMPMELRKIAFKYAEKNNIRNTFDVEKQMVTLYIVHMPRPSDG
ncbi:hypothetical protein JTB14_022467 [Gonioctena quinquepunctata]|nr:hypothetical protein JTB14_022467 [Gonioctena quinquepunctata]